MKWGDAARGGDVGAAAEVGEAVGLVPLLVEADLLPSGISRTSSVL